MTILKNALSHSTLRKRAHDIDQGEHTLSVFWQKTIGPKDIGPKGIGPKDIGTKDIGPKDIGQKTIWPKDIGQMTRKPIGC